MELSLQWAEKGNHPLKATLLKAAEALIHDQQLAGKGGIELMREIANYPGQYAALSIAYFVSNWASERADDEIENLDRAIRKGWEDIPK